jgi:glucose-6-phosphate 1-dehydrogenase
VSCVQITMAEDFGVEGRGAFYDSVGALRDVVQNHLLQVLALVAMDPPAGGSADDTQDKKAEVLRAMSAADPRHWVRGQYRGYADVPGVARGSATETYVALRLEIDNWRWADVPMETWRIVQPLLDNPPEVLPYPRGSWGPAEAGSLTRGHPHWQQPWLAVND